MRVVAIFFVSLILVACSNGGGGSGRDLPPRQPRPPIEEPHDHPPVEDEEPTPEPEPEPTPEPPEPDPLPPPPEPEPEPDPLPPPPPDLGAEISWIPPTTNVDGTALTDLDGYVLHYGPGHELYVTYIDVPVGLTRFFVQIDEATGVWCFAMQARNALGVLSEFSNEVCKDFSHEP